MSTLQDKQITGDRLIIMNGMHTNVREKKEVNTEFVAKLNQELNTVVDVTVFIIVWSTCIQKENKSSTSYKMLQLSSEKYNYVHLIHLGYTM